MEGENGNYIRIGGRPVSVSRDVYEAYYRMLRKERTIREKDARNRLIYYDAWDTASSSGRDVIPDKRTSAIEEHVIAAMTRDELDRCLGQLSDSERDLIRALFFEGKSVSELSRNLNIPYRTLGYRRDRALKKLRKLMTVNS